MFAVIRTGGKQYKVAEGETFDIELLNLEDKDSKETTISEVLLIGNGDQITLGKPAIAGATVTLEILEQIKARKVIAYKYRRREGYHRTVGHRQKLQRVKVSKIKV